LRAISSSSKSVTVVPSSTRPKTVHSAGVEQQRGEQLRLAGAAMTDQGDISQALSVINLHGRWPPTLPASRFQLSARND
jgi:hypothetical protein